MADYAISNVPRRVVYAASGTGPYAFTFEILSQTDIAVYKASTLLTLTTDYTVTINANGTGSVTLVTSAGTSNITIVGAKNIQRTTDFTTGGDLFANTLNDELDNQTIFIQQVAETAERGLKAPVVDPTDINMTLPAKASRVGTVLAFNATTGNPEAGPSIGSVTTVAAQSANINTVASNIGSVNTVAGNITNVNTVAGVSSNVTTVASNIANVNAVGADLLEGTSEINTVAVDIANVNTVGTNIASVNTVAGEIGAGQDVTVVAANLSGTNTIGTVATNIANVNATGTNIANVNAVGSDLLEAVSEINTVATDITNVNTVGTNIGSVNTVAGISSNVSTVAGISANVTTVAGINSAVSTVASNNANVTTVATNISSVNTCATDIAQIITTANDLNEAVSEIEVCANNIANINTVGTNISNVNTVAGISANVTTVATNVADINNFADVYQGAKATDPTLRNDGSALQSGDLYFNTTDDVMKVREAGAWLAAYASLSGALIAANNLSDLTSTSSARTNLGLAIGTNVQAYDAQLADIAGLTPTDNSFIVGNGANFVAEDASTARTSLGLGTLATQAANNVSITGGSVAGITDLAVADGGTGASTAANARVNLGVDNFGSMKNRIINGAMVIDQRNAGASVTQNTSGTQYSLDRWNIYGTQASKFTVQQNAGSVTPPAGFSNYLGVTSSSAYTLNGSDTFWFQQLIEGFNTADLDFGKSTAKTITISFWVRSSLIGTFGGVLKNSATDRNYPFSYTISAANTWEQKSVTVAGDTSGTWIGATNGLGLMVRFSLGSNYTGTAGAWAGGYIDAPTGQTNLVGTNGATFYITGVQLERGTQATGFEYRQHQQELALCQRYFETSYPAGATIPTALANGWSSITLQNFAEGPSGVIFKVTKRANPTMVMYNAVSAAAGAMYRVSDAASINTSFDFIGVNQVGIVRPSSSSANSYYFHWTASIEL